MLSAVLVFSPFFGLFKVTLSLPARTTRAARLCRSRFCSFLSVTRVQQPSPSQLIEKTRVRQTPDDCPRQRDAYEISASWCRDLSTVHSSPVLAGNIWNFIPAPRTLPNETEQLCSSHVDEPEIHEELRTTSHTGIKITTERRRGQRLYSIELAERSVTEASLFTRRLPGLNPRKQSAKTQGPWYSLFPHFVRHGTLTLSL